MLKEKKGADKRRAEAAKARKEATAAKVAAKPAIMAREKRQDPPTDDQEAEDRKSVAVNKREEALKRRAAARLLAKQEEEELEKNLLLKKLGREKVNKVTKAELESREEQEQEAIRRKIEKKNNRMTLEREYKEMVNVKNTNKDQIAIDAHTIDEAINQLHIADDYMKDPKLNALFKAFGDEQLPKLKQEKPGLTDSQYRNLMWKLWKRSGYVGEKTHLVSNAQKKKREERKSRGKTLVWESF